MRVDGPLGRRFLRGLSLTRLWREGCCRAPLNYRRRPLMKKPLQPHLLKRVPPACKGERTMKWRGRPPIGGQDSDRVSHRCFAPYTLLPLRGISPQGETRNLRRKTESHILHVPLRHSPFGGWRHHLARREACHLILSRLRLLANQVPLPPGGKHVTGFAGRLQLPYESSSFATPAVRWGGKRKAP